MSNTFARACRVRGPAERIPVGAGFLLGSVPARAASKQLRPSQHPTGAPFPGAVIQADGTRPSQIVIATSGVPAAMPPVSSAAGGPWRKYGLARAGCCATVIARSSCGSSGAESAHPATARRWTSWREPNTTCRAPRPRAGAAACYLPGAHGERVFVRPPPRGGGDRVYRKLEIRSRTDLTRLLVAESVSVWAVCARRLAVTGMMPPHSEGRDRPGVNDACEPCVSAVLSSFRSKLPYCFTSFWGSLYLAVGVGVGRLDVCNVLLPQGNYLYRLQNYDVSAYGVTTHPAVRSSYSRGSPGGRNEFSELSLRKRA
jgi:hypothetical protein